jgi:diguanylate cyclase (GGDEF)-like protein
VAIKLNITERKENEAKLLHMALYDPLTDLPNRGLLNDRLRLSMETARRNQHQIALMFVDLDYFKQINDTHGHDVGDLVLKQTAHRMKRQLRGTDTIARIGGDEFVALLPEVREIDESLRVAEKLLLALSEPIEIPDLRLNVTCSIGIALYPRDATDEIALYRHADEALYAVKNAGRNGIRVYGE